MAENSYIEDKANISTHACPLYSEMKIVHIF